MAILKASEIKDMSDQELNKKIKDLYLELAKEQAQVKIGGAPENPGKIREIKKTIARILTIKKERGEEK
jgi:large subunit ribosomal protein L29